MHKKDSMTPNERLAAFSKGEPVDRIPAMPFLSTVGPRLVGMTLREMRSSPRNEAFVQTECYKMLGNDSLTADYGLHGIGIALGSETNDPEDAVPGISKYAMDDLKDIDKLDMSKVERKNDTEFAKRYEAAEIMLDEMGGECGVDVTISGPFTAAASVYPTAFLLRAVRRDPENAHKLIRFCTESIKSVCRDFSSLGVSFTLCDPIASGTILRKADYLDFVFPYTCELVDEIHSFGTSAGYHICGNTTNIVESMVDTGVDLLSLDNVVDMRAAKGKVGNRVCIVGNVDPVKVMLEGTADDVESAVRGCFAQAWDSPCGFILATGCDIPNASPAENVERFMDAARKYGKWPLDGSRY
jgi:uroporphyrinogen decarboxylase